VFIIAGTLNQFNFNCHIYSMNQTAPQESWQDQLSAMIRDPVTLLKLLHLSPEDCGYSAAALAAFPLRVTHSYAARMIPGNPNDPLLRQVLPNKDELELVTGYSIDPLGERDASPVPGLLHKYHGRVLWVTTSPCAIHCRYCFRRHFPYDEHTLSRNQWQIPLNYIKANPEINEVIVSGAEPLSLNDFYLHSLLNEFEKIPHVTTVRFHSRLPIVLPARITPEFLTLLTQTRLHVVMVIHANHAQEINSEVAVALKQLRDAQITTFNQTVLLRGINDSAKILAELSRRLFHLQVIPYYLHILDPIQGAHHFAVSKEQTQLIHQQLQATLPGYLVPRLVAELAGASGKTWVNEI
jgi:EF-P beta-lysylation protein EpmB